jgi:transcriptional regulator with XRE-family HTH domain
MVLLCFILFNTKIMLEIPLTKRYNIPMKNLSLLNIGENIRKYRGLRSQGELGVAIGKDGSQVGRYERGEVDIPVSALLAIAKALGVKPVKLLQ